MTAFSELFSSMRNGLSVKQSSDSGGLPITRIETISAGYIDQDRVGYAALDRQAASRWLLEPGDVLFSHINSPQHVGKAALYAGSPSSLVHGMNLLCLRPNPKVAEPRWILHLVRSPQFRWSIQKFINRAVNQASISIRNLGSVEVELPSLDDQRRIAAILDQSDEIRTKRDRVLTQFNSLSQSIYLDMFGDPVANEHALPIRLLAGWIDPDRPITYGILKPGPHIDDGVPYVRVADMKDGGIDTASVRGTTAAISNQYKRSQLRSGDLLMSIRGHVGRFAFVPEELAGGNITQDSARLAVSEPVSAVYVRAAMEMSGLQQWMVRRTKGAAVRGINLGDLRQAPIPCPPLSMQTQFAAAVGKVRELRSLSHVHLALADEAFRCLQSDAFSAEL